MWYVFDECDCFGSFETASAAAASAESLVIDKFEGVHIAYMTKEQFDAYCKTGNLFA